MPRFVDSVRNMAIAAVDVGGTKIAGALVVYEIADGIVRDGVDCVQSLERSSLADARCETRFADAARPLGCIASIPPAVAARTSVPTNAKRGGAAVLQSIVDVVRELIDAAEMPVAGIGVGTAGVVNPATGSIADANDIMPGWTGQPVRQCLEDEFGLPSAVLGDVQAHALGEARWGAARGASSCLVVGIGTGLGGAFVANGQVMKGFHGAAGHIGHTLHPAAVGLVCACGKQAHVETVTSGTAIAAAYQGRAFGDELDAGRMGDHVASCAAEGELEAVAVLETAGRALGEALGSWCNILDPELVVLSGTVTQAGPLWRRAVDEGFKSQVLGPLADTPVVYAGLGSDAPLVGAAENLLDRLAQEGLWIRS